MTTYDFQQLLRQSISARMKEHFEHIAEESVIGQVLKARQREEDARLGIIDIEFREVEKKNQEEALSRPVTGLSLTHSKG